LGTATTATALVLPWNDENANAADEIPTLSISDWQKVRSMGFDQVRTAGKLADDFVKTIVNDLEDVSSEWRGETNDQDDQLTIWQLLNQDKDRYSKLLKAIEIEGGNAKKILDDRDASITFFAPENSGIPDPHHKDHDHDHFASFDRAIENLQSSPTLDNLLRVHDLHSQRLFERDEDHHHRGPHKGHEGDDDEKKKRIFKFILGEILKYHGLPQALSATELANNKTVATALYPKFGANDGQPLRIHLEKKALPPSLELNFYAKVVATHSDRKAINGYLHEIDHPLLPPPSVLTSAFFVRDFDTFTTAIQKIGETSAVAFEFSPKESKAEHHPVFRGNPAITAFLPTSDAFKKLPQKLQFFLFSPFGENVMRKLLGYHIIDKYVIFTESIHKVGTKGHRDPHQHHGHHDHEKRSSWFEDEIEALFMQGDDSTFHIEEEFPTMLPNASVKVTIDKSKVVPLPGASRTTLKVNGVEAETVDGVALNGAIHVLPEVLKPPHEHHDEEGNLVESSWENWEQWLVQWADTQ